MEWSIKRAFDDFFLTPEQTVALPQHCRSPHAWRILRVESHLGGHAAEEATSSYGSTPSGYICAKRQDDTHGA